MHTPSLFPTSSRDLPKRCAWRACTVLALTCTLTAHDALAARWTRIATHSKVTVEIDSGSVVRGDDGKVRVWFRETSPTPRLQDTGAFSFSRLTTLAEFNCSKRTVANIQLIYATVGGSELKNESYDTREAAAVTPDSTAETIFGQVCKAEPKKAVGDGKDEAKSDAKNGEKKEAKAEDGKNADTAKDAAPTRKPAKGKKGNEEPAPHVPARWTYSGDSGADKWASLDKDYETCGSGHQQSPIDIRNTVKADLPAIEFLYKAVPLSIVDNGHAIEVDTPNAGGIRIAGTTYDLVHFDFHKPGEEKINGKSYDMVVHLVHQAKSGQVAVIAVPMEMGKENNLIRALWSNLPLEQNKPVAREDLQIHPLLLIPPRHAYYTYLGSSTTPPCKEGVLWLVMKTPIQVSKEQLAGYATVYKNNARPVQPVNGRVIKESR